MQNERSRLPKPLFLPYTRFAPPGGYASYLLVWGSIHQWGFAWADGTLTLPGGARGRWPRAAPRR